MLLLLLLLLLLLHHSAPLLCLANHCPIVAQLQIAPETQVSLTQPHTTCALHHPGPARFSHWQRNTRSPPAAHLMSRVCGGAQQLSHLVLTLGASATTAATRGNETSYSQSPFAGAGGAPAS